MKVVEITQIVSPIVPLDTIMDTLWLGLGNVFQQTERPGQP